MRDKVAAPRGEPGGEPSFGTLQEAYQAARAAIKSYALILGLCRAEAFFSPIKTQSLPNSEQMETVHDAKLEIDPTNAGDEAPDDEQEEDGAKEEAKNPLGK